MNRKIRWITETGLMLAMLVAVQGITAGFGNQYITGSCVNLILAVTSLVVGLWGGVVVAGVSPFLASVFGIGPKFLQLLPGVAAGNLVFVMVLHFLVGNGRTDIRRIAGTVAAAAAKFVTLYLVVVKLIVAGLVDGGIIPVKASVLLSAQFSWPQLITALIGGSLSLAIVPVLKKALKK